MSLTNANEITIVTIDNLITAAIKDICDKKQRANCITTVPFMNKTRNDPTKPEIIEEKNVWLINNGTVINKPFNSHVFYHIKEKYISQKKSRKKFKH